MYTADKSKDHTLMGRNTTLTLGHIAVALRHEEKVSLSLLRLLLFLSDLKITICDHIWFYL